MPERRNPAGPPPTKAQLHEAALRHLARFAATEAGLVTVLDRRVLRWARDAGAEGGGAEGGGAEGPGAKGPGAGGMETEQAVMEARRAAREVARALAASGVIDDAAFAAARANRMVRAGRSRRSVAAHLAGKGVAPETVQAALPDPSLDLPSALMFARRRRIGPFRSEPNPALQLRDMGALARAGFPRDIAERALAMAADEAAAIVAALRRG